MNVTAGSTQADDAQRARRLPPDLLARTNTDLDELCQLRAEKAAAKARGQHAGSSKAGRVQAAIRVMAEQRALQLTRWTGSNRSKCEWLQGQLAAAIRGNSGNYMGITRAPHWTTISKIINGLHNVSTQ